MRLGILCGTIMGVMSILAAVRAQQGDKADGAKALDHHVGVWNIERTNKPSKWMPDGSKGTTKESVTKILKNRFVLGRGISQPDGGKSLWLMTYEPKDNSYLSWFYDNKGLLGGEWRTTWDESTRALTGKATDTPKGWTSKIGSRFQDKNSNHVAVWMKDETGALLLDAAATKVRQPDEAGAKVLAEWSRPGKPESPPHELKVLDRLIGSWDTVAVAKPAVWTPNEMRTTSKVTRKWVLDGRFVQDVSEISDGQKGFSLTTFDPQMKKYRAWWFNSEGHRNKSVGDWDAATETLSFKADLDDGLVARSTGRFINKDRHVWKVDVKDQAGKVYFDCEWTVTRRKE